MNLLKTLELKAMGNEILKKLPSCQNDDKQKEAEEAKQQQQAEEAEPEKPQSPKGRKYAVKNATSARSYGVMFGDASKKPSQKP